MNLASVGARGHALAGHAKSAGRGGAAESADGRVSACHAHPAPGVWHSRARGPRVIRPRCRLVNVGNKGPTPDADAGVCDMGAEVLRTPAWSLRARLQPRTTRAVAAPRATAH